MGGEIGSRETLRQLPGDALIAVDIGNTSVKLAVFSFAELGRASQASQASHVVRACQQGRASQDGQDGQRELPEPLVMQEWPTGSGEFALAPDDLPPRRLSWTVSSVHRPACQSLVEWVATHRPRDTVKVLNYRDVPLAIDVDFPERVGLDRLATAVAADFLRSPSRPAIVIDAGTALKVHVVTAERRFVGGAILPGFRMSSAALRGNTDLLPLVPVSTNIEPPPVLGKNTEAAIRSGIYWGAVGAVRELVQRVKLELGVEPQVFITGGDARGLTSLIDHDTRYVPYLCLGGIALMAERPSLAVLTPAGRGAVATVGVWGPAATQLVQGCFHSATGRQLADTPLDRVLLGSWNGAEELVLARRGDERLEIHCHGGLAASEAIVESLVERGARRAAPSEWLTSGGLGRIEVEAAEALARAQTERTAAILLDQYRGALRREITELIELIASIKQAEPTKPTKHASIVEETNSSNSASAVELRFRLEQLVARAKVGVRLTDPWRVVLTGKPNVGKSSLINALLGYERAIVSDMPGTTRDVVTATTALDGWPIALADTAGRRATDEPLEASGIELAVHRLSEADLVLLVVDHDGPFDAEESAILARHPDALVVRNKCDLAPDRDDDRGRANANAAWGGSAAIRVSATTAAGLDALQSAILARLVPQSIPEHVAVPFTARQVALLERALAAACANAWAHCDESLLALVERL